MPNLTLVKCLFLSGIVAFSSEKASYASQGSFRTYGHEDVLVYAPKRFSAQKSGAYTGQPAINVKSQEFPLEKKPYVVVPNQVMENMNKTDAAALYIIDAKSSLMTTGVVLSMWEQDWKYLYSRNQQFTKYQEANTAYEKRSVIRVYPYILGNEINAYYDSLEKTLNFYSLPNLNTNMCRVFDVVAHEAGHAFLDMIQPRYLQTPSFWNNTLHEAFGDISAILASLEVTLKKSSEVASQEAYGYLVNRSDLRIEGPEIMGCIRRPDAFVGFATHEMHNASNPFTKAFFESLRMACNVATMLQKDLRDVLDSYRRGFLHSIINQENIEEGNNAMLIALGKILVSYVDSQIFENKYYNAIYLPFSRAFDSLTATIIFNPDDMKNFATIPVPSNIEESEFHEF